MGVANHAGGARRVEVERTFGNGQLGRSLVIDCTADFGKICEEIGIRDIGYAGAAAEEPGIPSAVDRTAATVGPIPE